MTKLGLRPTPAVARQRGQSTVAFLALGAALAIVSVRAADLATAYGKLAADSARVVTYIGSVVGADAERLQQGTVNTQTVYKSGPGGVQTGRVLGYELSRQFEFSSKNVAQIGAATKDSLLRAQQFAANSGVMVGPLRSASQGVFQITSPNSTETADYGSYDTSTVEKLVKAVVTVEYAVTRK